MAFSSPPLPPLFRLQIQIVIVKVLKTTKHWKLKGFGERHMSVVPRRWNEAMFRWHCCAFPAVKHFEGVLHQRQRFGTFPLFSLEIITPHCSSFLCSHGIRWLIIFDTSLMGQIKYRAVLQMSGSYLNWVWNVCFRPSGFTSPLSCLSSWKTGIMFQFPLNHRAKPVTGANQLTLTKELTHEIGCCWITLPEKTESWGFNSPAMFKILLCSCQNVCIHFSLLPPALVISG